MDNDFDNGTTGSGWNSTSSAQFDNPCDPSFDGGTYLWMGDAAAHPRILETDQFDLSCGGQVCFYLDFATQGDASPCEGPDLPDEGVYFQYSTDGGASWTTIEYFGPNGVGDSTNNGGTDPQMTSWNEYCFTLPPGAETANTSFQWIQDGSSGNTNDHWGIDNVQIFANDCDYYYNWTDLPGDTNQRDTSVFVYSDSTFNVIYTNGIDDTCYASVSVNYLFPDVDANASPVSLCPGETTTLEANLSNFPPDTCCYTLDMQDSYGDGWNGGELTVYEDGTSIGTFAAAGSGSTEQFCVNDGSLIELEYTSGSFESENTYTLYDPNGNSLFSDGPSPTTGFVYSTTANCGTPTTYDVSWSPSGGLTDPNDSITDAVVDSTTTYVVTVEDPNDPSCYTQDSVTVTAVDAQAAIEPPDTITCDQTTVTLDGSASYTSSGNIDHSWSTSNGSIVSGANSATVDVDQAGDYTLTVTDPTAGCSVDSTITVPADTTPPQAVIAQPDTLTCTNNSVTLDGSPSTSSSGNLDYNWSTGDVSATTTVSSAGTYTLTVEDPNNGCTHDTTITVPIDTASPDAVVAQPDTLTCTNTSVTLDGSASTSNSGNVDYSWSTGDNSSTTTVSAGGSYTLTVTDPNNGCTDDTTLTVPVDTTSPDAVVAAPDTLTCTTTSVTLDGSASTSANSHSYSWSTGDNTATTTVSSAGNYTLTVTDDVNGCVDDTTVTVPIDTVAPTIDIAQPDTFYCMTDSVVLDATGSTTNSGSKDYSWSALSGAVDNGSTTATPQVGSSGDYELTLTDPNNGCTSVDTVTVPADQSIPNADIASPDTLTCSQTTVTLDATGSSTSSGNIEWGWSTTGGNIVGAAADSSTIDVDVDADYTVTVTDPDNGCESSTTVTVPIDTASPDAVVAAPDTLTCTNTSVTLDASASTSASGTHGYAWSNGLTGSSITVTSGGSYTVTVTDDNNGCTDDTTLTVPVDTVRPTADLPLPDTLTCTNTSVTVDASGSTSNSGALDYSWSTTNGNISSGTTSSTIDVDQSGDYDVTLTDPANGCTYDTTAVVHVDSIAPTIDIAPVDTFYCTTDSVVLDATGSTTNSGNTDYSWSALSGTIDNGSTTATPQVGSSGDYELTLTDPNNGCTSVDTVTVPADQNLPNADIASPDTLTCSQTTVTLDATGSSTSSGNIEWGWSTTGGNIVGAAADSSTIDVDVDADYTVTVTDPDNGCESSTTVTVPIDTASPDAVVAAPDTLTCTNTSVTLDASASTSNNGHSYSWSTGDTGPTTTVTSAGSYTLTVTDDVNGCTEDTTLTVPVDTVSPDAIVASPDTLTCTTTSVTLDGSGSASNNGHSYTWSTGDNTATTTVTSAGSYTLTVTDDVNGCSEDTTLTVPIDTASPNASIADPDTLTCASPTVTLDASGSTTNSGSADYAWSTGDNTSSTSVSSPGSYSVTVTDATNGCTDDTTVVVEEANMPTVTLDSTQDALCNGSCDGEAYVSASGGSSPYSYQWDDPNGQTGPDATGLCAGSYEVVVTDDNGCTDTTDVTIGEPSELQVSTPADTTICIDGTATLSADASGGTPGYTYHWDQGLGTGQTQTVSPGSSTVYEVYATDANQCTSATASIRVDHHPPLQVDASVSDSICPGDSIELTASGSGGIGPPYDHDWSNGDTGPTTTVAPTSATSYTVTLEDGCETPSVTDTVEVKVNELPDVSFSGTDLTGCAPVEATLVNTTDSSDVGGSCVWDFGDGTQASGCDTVTHSYEEPGCYDVTLTVTSPDGCVDSTREMNMVCVYDHPVADFDADPEETTVQDPEVDFTNMSMGAEEYEWDFGGLDTSSEEDPSYSFPAEGEGSYEVCLTATSSYGCQDSTCRTVLVNGEFILYVPNAFTPDGDGKNDEFKPVVQGIDERDYEFMIFDRWGEVVFEAHHPEEAWDGSIKGQQSAAKPDVYVWRLVTKNKYTGAGIERTGHVTLLR